MNATDFRSLIGSLRYLTHIRPDNGESFQHKDTRVPGKPRYDIRKRTNSKEQKNSMLLLIQKFEKLLIHEKNEENLSKKRKEGVDPRGLRFPSFPIKL